jgi:hypothetical protein
MILFARKSDDYYILAWCIFTVPLLVSTPLETHAVDISSIPLQFCSGFTKANPFSSKHYQAVFFKNVRTETKIYWKSIQSISNLGPSAFFKIRD